MSRREWLLHSDLDRLANTLRSDGYQRFIDSIPIQKSCSKFVFPTTAREDLFFENYYSDAWVLDIPRDAKLVAINRRNRLRSPRQVSVEDIRSSVDQCIQTAQEGHATVALKFYNCCFIVPNNLSKEDERQFFNQDSFQGLRKFMINGRTIDTSLHGHEWMAPSQVINYLTKNGIEEVSCETIEPKIILNLKLKPNSSRKINENFCFGDKLMLNNEDLSVASWKLGCLPLKKIHFMHGFPSSTDVTLSTITHLGQSITTTIEDLKEMNPNLSPIFTEPGLDGCLQENETGFLATRPLHGVKKLTKYERGEKINLKYKNVTFSITLNQAKLYFYSWRSQEFTPLSQDCNQFIEFKVSGDSEEIKEITDAVTHVTRLLFEASNRFEMKIDPIFFGNAKGKALSAANVQAISRLHNEEGSLRKLLGLGDACSREDCQQRSSELKTILQENKAEDWFQRRSFDFNHLMEKLTNACHVMEID